MSGIEELPAEQRAVLQLALRSDKPFRQLAVVLDIDEAEMRRRAHAALAALGPDSAGDLEPVRRDEIGDWLLGQQDDDERTATERFLVASAAGRAWARAVGDQLRGLGAQRLPDVPAAGRADDRADADGAAVPPATPIGAGAMTPADAPAAAEAAAAAPVPPDGGAGLAAPRSSRLGGALLLGGLAVVAVAVILFFVLRGGGGSSSSQNAAPAASTSTSTTATTSTTAAQAQAQVEAQANLVPPSSRKGLKALGVVLVQRAQGRHQIVAAVQGLPTPKQGGYGIWLYSGPRRARWLGFFASRDRQGRLLARGQLDASIADYREILVTREAKGNPPRPGPIFLRGPVQLAGKAHGG